MNYQGIKANSEKFGVDLAAALAHRRQHLWDVIIHNQEILMRWAGVRGMNLLHRKLIRRRLNEAYSAMREAFRQLGELDHPVYRSGNGVTEDEINRARGYPVENLLPNPVKNHMTICPFHEDVRPSMTTKGNFAWCFSENKGWDPIDLAMSLKDLSFVEAVRYLTNN